MKYTINRHISSGSFGTVYEILNEEDNKVYALKELTNMDTVSKQRFEREVKTLSELNHPNIVKVFYWNVGGDAPKFTPYYIMEYLGGNSLKEYMAEKFDNDEKYYFGIGWTISNIVLPVCNALAQAHSSNIYHRDLKPSNIMFTDDTKSSIKIADWGLVKIGESSDSNSSYNTSTTIDLDRRSLELTAVVSEGNIGGTPDYCSPEQWFATVNDNDRLIDGRTDIFSLGVILYEMLTRRRPPPYDPNNPGMSRSVVNSPSEYNSLIPPPLDQCVLKMIDLKPENRQQSIWDLMSEIEILSI
ncbi:MAG: serine/threonine-protein kinase [Nitrososphaeraceae archaeon]|nr:serine/threonine-protein kinase [Nitrososphaeraceae archaeon]MDW0314571.1 serine/threonine-protein kinase [Nitrososphaeraceae archaeon]MDW0333374.1 serine/threonine-protein kinase [Nitrososphaeraceae archaeon]HET6716713.1 serine/threonine-protein kinase [Nitrososphaeraceae archaeon]